VQLTALACHPALVYGGLRHYSSGPRRSYGHSMRVRTCPTMGYYRLRLWSGSFLTKPNVKTSSGAVTRQLMHNSECFGAFIHTTNVDLLTTSRGQQKR
jgi:hypothetical protein